MDRDIDVAVGGHAHDVGDADEYPKKARSKFAPRKYLSGIAILRGGYICEWSNPSNSHTGVTPQRSHLGWSAGDERKNRGGKRRRSAYRGLLSRNRDAE